MNKKDLEALKKSKLSEEELIQSLSKKGYKIEKIIPEKIDKVTKIDTSLFEGDEITFAVLSCTHLGSKFQQLTHLKTFYKYIQDRGIKAVLHCGDVVDGDSIYRGQEYELFLHGEKAQRDYAIENYPRMENGGKTFAISGNHDHSFYKKAGVDALENIALQRDDIEYLGLYGAYPQLPKLKCYMQHGSGGGSYARSYRLQKMIEQFAPEKKPDIYFFGHLHTTCALFEYRNVTAFMIPCFQAQTPYLRRRNLYPEVGGLIISFIINDKGRKHNLARMKFEWIPFFKMIEKDY